MPYFTNVINLRYSFGFHACNHPVIVNTGFAHWHDIKLKLTTLRILRVFQAFHNFIHLKLRHLWMSELLLLTVSTCIQTCQKLTTVPENPKVTTGFTFLTTGFKLTTEGSFPLTTGFNAFWRGFKSEPPLPTASDFQTSQNTNKGFQQQPMCRNPLFSAVFAIFYSVPLYQISGLHFYVNAVFDTIRFCLIHFDFDILFDFAP